MIESFLQSTKLQSYQAALKTEKTLLVDRISSSMKAFLTSFLENKDVLIITRQDREDTLFECLQFFLKKDPLEFPSWETLPEEEIAPSPDIVGKRLETLQKVLTSREGRVVLCPYPSLLQKLPPKEELDYLFQNWCVGSQISFDSVFDILTYLGYKRQSIVSDKGQFAIRGGIIDLFPNHTTDPFRIEFFEDTIESIRTFDPIGQKSIKKVDQLLVVPANEEHILSLCTQFVSILDYLKDPVIIFEDLLKIEDVYVSLKKILEGKGKKTFHFSEILEKMQSYQTLFFSSDAIENLGKITSLEKEKDLQRICFEMFDHTFSAKRFFHPFQGLSDYLFIDEEKDLFNLLKQYPGKISSYFVIQNTQEKQIIEDALQATSFQKTYQTGYLPSGFAVADISSLLIPYSEIVSQKRVRRPKLRNTCHIPMAEFHELTPGDLVVHFHSGIGKYLGVEKQINHEGIESEYMALEFAEKSKLFVPLSQSYLVSRYIGSQESLPTLNKLGTKKWQKTKEAAQQQILGYASDLLQLYAEREYTGGFTYPDDSKEMHQFELEFPYTETPDQLAAIQQIKQDMCSEKAMDRLLCGDVGYGKTEVAMRAAFKAVVDGQKQVAVLVPTTVLASQHLENFQSRMQPYPISIEMISRFNTPKKNKEILQKLEQGTIDIVIGTHRLLSKDIAFQKLGLIIIDEEQRFGVRAKEHLKKLKKGVDSLSLSATPIPRTLYMSLITIRDMSVIGTPPQDRLPIKSIIAETDDLLIQNAIQRELARSGQVFFIHNRVETIYKWKEKIAKLVPEAKIGIVHGQMSSDEIDQIFHQFKLGNIQILIATTIIENGIDIPNANTILVDRSDTYGLANLYQLRGRVGRWNKSAYAYFLVPKQKALPEIARKRLSALIEAGSYGAGMKIAMRDLEIRGAGDILGTQQSGQVSSIGFHLYCKLLKRAVEALKQKAPISFSETKMEFPFNAQIPSSYIPESSIRMELYHRFGETNSPEGLFLLIDEIKDRFGKPPESVVWLYHMSRIRAFAAKHHFVSLKFMKRSFIAEKKQEKRTLLYSGEISDPAVLEQEIIAKLQKEFP